MQTQQTRHNARAPFWAAALIILIATGLATIRIELGPFWRGYMLDIVGPAWAYILFRGLFTSYADNAWTRFFSPARTAAILLMVCYGIECAQYLELYPATFDPWDFLAYSALVLPFFLLDTYLIHAKFG